MERVDLDAIERRADAAMSGPWRYAPFRSFPGVVKPAPSGPGVDCVIAQMVNAGKDTAEHIAGMDPQTTLAITAELRAVREVLRRTYERLSQDGYDYDGPTLARIREFLTGRPDAPSADRDEGG